MASVFKAKIEGEAELRAALRNLPKQIENKILAKALRAGGNELRRAIRQATPVRTDPPGPKKDGKTTRSPGHLRKAWRVTIRREQGLMVAYVHPGKSGYYGYFLETRPGLRPFVKAAAEGAVEAANMKVAAVMRAELAALPIGRGISARV